MGKDRSVVKGRDADTEMTMVQGDTTVLLEIDRRRCNRSRRAGRDGGGDKR